MLFCELWHIECAVKSLFKLQYKTVMVLLYLLICCMSCVKKYLDWWVMFIYFVRYHFNKDCLVVQWSGDNPNSVAGAIISSLTCSIIYLWFCIFFLVGFNYILMSKFEWWKSTPLPEKKTGKSKTPFVVLVAKYYFYPTIFHIVYILPAHIKN